MFFIPLTGGSALRIVRTRLIATDLANHKEFFRHLHGDLSYSGIHAAYTAVLEFRVLVLTVVVHADAPL